MATKAKKEVLRVIRGKGRLTDVSKTVRKRAARVVRCVARPNRTFARRVQPQAAADFACAAVETVMRSGRAFAEAQREVRAAIERCVPCAEPTTKEQQQQAEASIAATALDALSDNARTLAIGIAVVASLVVLSRLAGSVVALLPVAGALGVRLAVRQAITEVPALLTRMRATAAANDAARAAIAQRAANDAVFRAAAGLR